MLLSIAIIMMIFSKYQRDTVYRLLLISLLLFTMLLAVVARSKTILTDNDVLMILLQNSPFIGCVHAV